MQGNISGANTGTLASVLENLIPGCTTNTTHLLWPPNVFAICAYLLKLTGSYHEVLNYWPPRIPWRSYSPHLSWEEWVRAEGKIWRSTTANKNGLPPQGVMFIWNQILAAGNYRFEQVTSNIALVADLLQLVALADEASVGAGIPHSPTSRQDLFRDRTLEYLAGLSSSAWGISTLTPDINPALLRALPKQHTPRVGLTLRSLSHHLALHIGSEVEPIWRTIPKRAADNSLNLLVAPWPLTIRPIQFQPAQGRVNNLPNKFGYVEFRPDEDPYRVSQWTRALLNEAHRIGGRVDGIIFPEAALTNVEYMNVRKAVLDDGVFLIAGVLREENSGPPSNLVMIDANKSTLSIHHEQMKHHRWRLDRGQIEMYGLGGTLDSDWNWWENIAIGPRQIYFITLSQQLSLCLLACEDLARQEPVAELVRSVGPNLVITLLMDAPQLNFRWPARYATVLADDPGSSVLTVTSAGMVDLARTPKNGKPSRSVGLWKDARSDSVELELPRGASGLLLNLCTELVEEWTVDGRSDGGTTGYPRLGGVHPIWL